MSDRIFAPVFVLATFRPCQGGLDLEVGVASIREGRDTKVAMQAATSSLTGRGCAKYNRILGGPDEGRRRRSLARG